MANAFQGDVFQEDAFELTLEEDAFQEDAFTDAFQGVAGSISPGAGTGYFAPSYFAPSYFTPSYFPPGYISVPVVEEEPIMGGTTVVRRYPVPRIRKSIQVDLPISYIVHAPVESEPVEAPVLPAPPVRTRVPVLASVGVSWRSRTRAMATLPVGFSVDRDHNRYILLGELDVDLAEVAVLGEEA